MQNLDAFVHPVPLFYVALGIFQFQIHHDLSVFGEIARFAIYQFKEVFQLWNLALRSLRTVDPVACLGEMLLDLIKRQIKDICWLVGWILGILILEGGHLSVVSSMYDYQSFV